MKVLENIGQFVAGKMKLVYNVIDNHKRDTNNPHKVTKSDVGLGNVDNTSDADKPLSNAASNALGSINESLNASKNVIDEIRYGSIVIGKSEYAEKLGTPTDNFTKKQIDQILDALLSNVDLDPETFSLSFSYRDGRSKTFDLPIEDTVKDGRYDEEARELVLVLVSGQEIRIQAPVCLKYILAEVAVRRQSVSMKETGRLPLTWKRSITKGHLTTELQTEIDKLANVPENANDTFAKKEELKAHRDLIHYILTLQI